MYPTHRNQMGRQRKMFQTKQEKYSKKELKGINEMEVTKIPGEDFKTRVIQMLKDLRGRMDDLNKEIVNIKRTQKP